MWLTPDKPRDGRHSEHMGDKQGQFWDFRVCGWVRHDRVTAPGEASAQAPVVVPDQHRPAIAEPAPSHTPVGKPK